MFRRSQWITSQIEPYGGSNHESMRHLLKALRYLVVARDRWLHSALSETDGSIGRPLRSAGIRPTPSQFWTLRWTYLGPNRVFVDTIDIKADHYLARIRSRRPIRQMWRIVNADQLRVHALKRKPITVSDRERAQDRVRVVISADTASINRGEYCLSEAGLAMVSQLWATRLAAENGGGIFLDMFPHWRYVIDNLFGSITSVFAAGAVTVPRRVDENG